jgi:hypothetical protein
MEGFVDKFKGFLAKHKTWTDCAIEIVKDNWADNPITKALL